MSVAFLYFLNINAANGVAFLLGLICSKIHLEKSFTVSFAFMSILNISTAYGVAFLL